MLVEKPLGVTVEECEALQKQVQTSGLLLQVGTMKRFDPGIAFESGAWIAAADVTGGV